MNIVEKEMDAYEIAENLFNNTISDKDILSIYSSDLKIYFEMLLIITMEGLKKFHGVNGKVNVKELSLNDINKINEYLKKMKIRMYIKTYQKNEWEKKQNIIKPYNLISIDNTTNLKDLYFIIYNDEIYVLWFDII